MRSKNRNFKVMGLAGMLVAGLAAGSLPAEPVSAANGWEIDLVDTNVGEVPSVMVTIGGDVSGATLFPGSGDEGKAMAMIKRTVGIEIGATDGYEVMVSGNPDLVGRNVNNKIPGVSSATVLGQMRNQWGWYSMDGDVLCDKSSTFRSVTDTGERIASGGVLADTTVKQYTVCFGAKVDENQAADIYSNSVMVSVVAQPRSTAIFSGVTTMQEMNAEICDAAAVNDTAYLKDVRDGKSYWVTKLADGRCWMSQNLDLDLASTVTATYRSNSSETFEWTVGSNGGMTSAGPAAVEVDNKYAWDLGKYVIKDPTTITDCGQQSVVGMSNCAGFVEVGGKNAGTDPNFYKNNGGKTYTEEEYDAHYLVGNLYQWNTATAGTGAGRTDGDATASICPKNWELPSTAVGDSAMVPGTYAYLLKQYGLASAYNAGSLTGTENGYNYDVVLSPLFFVRAGHTWSEYQPFLQAGSSGRYWTSRSSGTYDEYYGYIYAYGLNVNNTLLTLSPDNWNRRSSGYSVRCLVSS